MATMLRRLARAAAAPIANPHASRGQSSSTSATSPLPFAAIASISAALSSFYYFNSPNLVHLEEISEEPAQKLGSFFIFLSSWIEA
uniref:Uncharacterized protein n=1 Tax=Daucus carota subsp. sativus TaxID=79200 RepID=A0A164YJ04_DAUCS